MRLLPSVTFVELDLLPTYSLQLGVPIFLLPVVPGLLWHPPIFLSFLQHGGVIWWTSLLSPIMILMLSTWGGPLFVALENVPTVWHFLLYLDLIFCRNCIAQGRARRAHQAVDKLFHIYSFYTGFVLLSAMILAFTLDAFFTNIVILVNFYRSQFLLGPFSCR
jgi:hypothetical protein